MNSTSRHRRLTAAALTALAVAVTSTACGSGSDGGSNTADSGTYTIWDPY
ncbi:MAG: sugar ABC transporter substrate-binding protein, partial [Streptomyces sp.]|nr:sugar ABC transporter substrate-binding protein [Streptomyces sp.]